MFLFISRLLYNEIVMLFRLILFITSYSYNKFTQKYDILSFYLDFNRNILIKPLLARFF